MSVSMLLNAANVVKAAERCKAIDETNGRIPINFLLSRSNDLDDQVKHQLQQLAVSSPSISLHSKPPSQPAPPAAPLAPSSASSATPEQQHRPQQPASHNNHPHLPFHYHSSSHQPAPNPTHPPPPPPPTPSTRDADMSAAAASSAHTAAMSADPSARALPGSESLRSLNADELVHDAFAARTGGYASASDSDTDEEAALRDIDDASTSQQPKPDRKLLRLGKQNGRLTRKAIRKHSAAVEPGAMLHMPLLPPRQPVDGSSTIHTTSAASQPSVSSLSGVGVGMRRMPIPSNFPTFNGRRDAGHGAAAAAAAAAATAAGSDNEGECASMEAGEAGGKMPRRRWKAWEDELLIQVVSEHGPSRWNTLARHFPGRNGRQVRLRWMNHLQPSLDKRPWRADEDAVLMEAHQALGNKWALISMRLCGRTDNSVKNRYKSIVRRAAREAKARRSGAGGAGAGVQ